MTTTQFRGFAFSTGAVTLRVCHDSRLALGRFGTTAASAWYESRLRLVRQPPSLIHLRIWDSCKCPRATIFSSSEGATIGMLSPGLRSDSGMRNRAIGEPWVLRRALTSREGGVAA